MLARRKPMQPKPVNMQTHAHPLSPCPIALAPLALPPHRPNTRCNPRLQPHAMAAVTLAPSPCTGMCPPTPPARSPNATMHNGSLRHASIALESLPRRQGPYTSRAIFLRSTMSSGCPRGAPGLGCPPCLAGSRVAHQGQRKIIFEGRRQGNAKRKRKVTQLGCQWKVLREVQHLRSRRAHGWRVSEQSHR